MGPNLTTSTPWIAYISCDVNETTASQEWGELAVLNGKTSLIMIRYLHFGEGQRGSLGGESRMPPSMDSGADTESQLLYTARSSSCLLNAEYINDFEKPLDVFATKTVQVAR